MNNKMTVNTPKEVVVMNAALENKTLHDDEAVEAIKNKNLKANIKSYLKAENQGRKAGWAMVRLLASMSEYIKEDFGSDYKFAEFMEMSQATINKRKRLGAYAVDLENNGYTDSQAMEMLPLLSKAEDIIRNNSDDIEEAEHFRTQVINDIATFIPNSLSQKEIRKECKNLIAFWNVDQEQPMIGLDNDLEEEIDTDTTLETTEIHDSLENYSDEEEKEKEEIYIEYTFPWIKDGGLVDETFQVSEEIAIEIAKAIMQIISKY